MDLSNRDEIIKDLGFEPIKGWFGKLQEEFYKKHKFCAYWYREGKIYGYYQLIYFLGLDTPLTLGVEEPADAVYWLYRKEILKKELNINFD